MEDNEVVLTARRTESMDAPSIEKLMTNSTVALFGRIDIMQVIEKANLSVTLVSSDGEVVASGAFFDYPNVSVDQAKWEKIFQKSFNSISPTPMNSLFLNFFVSKSDYVHGCASEILRTVFNTAPYIEYVFLVVPKTDIEQGQALDQIFSNVEQNENFNNAFKGALKVCHRYQHSPKLHIRAASVEDHDDLTPIFNEQSEALINSYGDFFLNDLIEAEDEENRCIVADVNGTAVGFMSIRSSVDIELLSECFDLTPFNGLRKPPVNSDESSETRPSEEESVASEMGSVSEITEQMATVQTNELLFEGQESVFCIELFCIDEKFESRSMDFLPAAFNLFPDKDYCVITMPHIVNDFPLVHEFTRVTPKVDATLPHELYVFHRWGLIRSFNVRHAVSSDKDGLKNIVSGMSGSEFVISVPKIRSTANSKWSSLIFCVCEGMLAQLANHSTGDSVLQFDFEQYNGARRDQDGQELRVFVAECYKQIVGVAVIRQEEDIEFIRAHYAVEDFIYFNHHERREHAHLFHFTLNGIFRHYTRYFLKEILRLSHKSCLYYSLYPKFVDLTMSNTKPYSAISCLGELVPVRSRRQIIYHEDILGVNCPSEKVLKKMESFALYHLNRKLTLEPKLIVNARIVVVGASNTGVSFLEKFCFCPHLHFKNVTLISPQGLPGEIAFDKRAYEMRPTSCCYTKKDYAQLSLETWINIVEDKMVSIDRVGKIITTFQGHKVPYDYLVLCCGQQFQFPIPSGADISTLVTTAEVPKTRDEVFKGKLPNNVFTVNSERDAHEILSWIDAEFVHGDGVAVIYGSALESYTFIQGLLSSGVPGSRIAMVEPPQLPPTCFNNPDVEDLVQSSLDAAGITVHKDYTLAKWNDKTESSDLKNATFTSSNKPLVLECQAFFSFQEKKVDYNAYKAINDSCLVYDGKLVVDKDFLTNDPTIRAAGSLTKFARHYHAESWSHANFNSKEVGEKLAMSMLPLFDPTLEQSLIHHVKEANLIPVFKEPKVWAGTLPGGFHYLHIGKPNLNIRLDSLMAQPDYGRVFITGAAGDQNQGYFRLHFSQYNCVETITCVSKQPIDTSNLVCLYGIHERYLNNLYQRCAEGSIKDFYSYFKESWCVAIFHDRFKDLGEEIREILSSVMGHDLDSINDNVRKLIDEDLELSPADRESLRIRYAKSFAKKEVERTLLNFLNYNSPHLPMYAKPEMI